MTPVAAYYSEIRTMGVVLVCLGGGLMLALCLLLTRLYGAKEAANAESRNTSTFFIKIGHELRAPLDNITETADLILGEENHLPPGTGRRVLSIKQASQGLLALINDVLDLSKIESGSLEIKRAPYSLASVIDDVINTARVQMVEKRLLFSVFIDSAIPGTLVGDKIRIRQVLLNLLFNAVKYTDQGFVTLEVKLNRQEEKNVWLEIKVADSGRGIKNEDLPRLSGAYKNTGQMRGSKAKGVGLGLAITRELIRLMRGEIIADSLYGQGSTFAVCLPQEYNGEKRGKTFACVKNAEQERVLVYGTVPLYLSSFSATLENLNVPHTLAMTIDGFWDELQRGVYTFAFVDEMLMEEVQGKAKTLSLKTTILFYASTARDTGVAEGSSHNTLPMPVHALSVARVLNRTSEPCA